MDNTTETPNVTENVNTQFASTNELQQNINELTETLFLKMAKLPQVDEKIAQIEQDLDKLFEQQKQGSSIITSIRGGGKPDPITFEIAQQEEIRDKLKLEHDVLYQMIVHDFTTLQSKVQEKIEVTSTENETRFKLLQDQVSQLTSEIKTLNGKDEALENKNSALSTAKQKYETSFKDIQEEFIQKLKEIQEQYQSDIGSSDLSPEKLLKQKDVARDALETLQKDTKTELKTAKETYAQAIDDADKIYTAALNPTNPVVVEKQTLEKMDSLIQERANELIIINTQFDLIEQELQIFEALNDAQNEVNTKAMDAQQQIISILQKQNGGLQETNGTLQTTVDTPLVSIEVNSKLIEQQQLDIAKYKLQLVGQEGVISKLNEQLKSLENYNDELLFKLEQQNQTLVNQALSIQTLESKKVKLSADLNSLNKQILSLNENAENLQKDFVTSKQSIELLNEKNRELHSTIESMSPETIQGAKEILNNLFNPSIDENLSILEIIQKNPAEQYKIRETENPILLMYLELDSTTQQLERQQKINSELQEEKTRLENENKALNWEKVEKETQYQELEKQNGSLSNQISDLKKQNVQLQEKIDENTKAMQMQQQVIDETQRKLDKKTTDFDGLSNTYSQNLYELGNLQKLNAEMTKSLQTLSDKNKELEERIPGLADDVKTKTGELEELRRQKELTEREKENLNEELVNLTEKATNASTKVQELEREYRELIPKYESLLAEQSELTKELAKEPTSETENAMLIQQRLTACNIEVDETKNSLSNLKKDIKELSGIDMSLTQKISEGFDKLSQAEDFSREQQNEMTRLESELKVLGDENNGLKQELEQLKELNKQQSLEIETLQTKNQHQTQAISDIETKMFDIDDLAKKLGMKLFEVKLQEKANPSLDTKGTTFNIENESELRNLVQNGLNLVNKESDIPFTMHLDAKNIPSALLKTEDCNCSTLEAPEGTNESTHEKNLRNTAICVTNIIDNILANNNTVKINTDNPVIHAIASQYIEKLKEKGCDFKSEIHLDPSVKPIEGEDLSKVNALLPQTKNENIMNAIKEQAGLHHEESHPLTKQPESSLLKSTTTNSNVATNVPKANIPLVPRS